MAIRHEYKEGVITRAIVDILQNSWPKQLKAHILIKELLWHIDFPRGVAGNAGLEVPSFSIEAKKRWESNAKKGAKGRKLREGLVLEHAIPRSLLCERLLTLSKIDYKSVREFQERYIKRAYVLKEEDNLLNANGLRASMPDDWTWETGEVWARHKLIDIKHTNPPKGFAENVEDSDE